MNLYKLLVVILCFPIASFGQGNCQVGQSYLYISTNGDQYSLSENEVTISSENGTFDESFDMSPGVIDNEYFIGPGSYTVKIKDNWGDGFAGCGQSEDNHIRVYLDDILIYESDCSTSPSILSSWNNLSHEFTIAGCNNLAYIEAYEGTTYDDQCVITYIGSVGNYEFEDPTLCVTEIIYGCTDTLYANYDPNANSPSSQCDSLLGCIDSDACNYNPLAVVDNSSCSYPPSNQNCDGAGCNDATYIEAFQGTTYDEQGIIAILGTYVSYENPDQDLCLTSINQGCTDQNYFDYDPNANFLNPSECDSLLGCTDIDACNYNPDAVVNSSCIFPLENYDCDNSCFNDEDSDGVCDELEIEGCTDDLACNYDATLTTDTDNSLCNYLIDLNECASCSGETDGSGTIVNNDDDDDGVCNNDEIIGCTDPIALNYNPAATDDGSCAYDVISGCMNETACNYNPAATLPGFCDIPYDDCDSCSEEGIVINNDSDNDGICNADEITGCTDSTACGYNPNATDDDGTCFNSEQYYDCDGNCLIDSNNNQICDELELSGCQDELACNYNENAYVDDGSCYFAVEFYDCDDNCLSDTDNDGTCDQLESAGCTDVLACNFNPFASDDDGSCESTSCYGCLDANACNYNATTLYSVPESCIYTSDVSDCATCSGEQDGTGQILDNDADDDGVCDADETFGCTDQDACNYDATPTIDTDNSLCNYPTDVSDCATCSGQTDGTGTIVDNDNDNDGVCNDDEVMGCSDSNACNYNPLSTDESECNYALEYYDCDGNCLNDIDNNSICDEIQVDGCTATDACNYNENANVNDGSCDFPEDYYDCSGNCTNDSDLNGICDELEVGGCTDSEACNYNANATIDNGTCEYLEVTLEYNNLSSSLEASSNASLPTYQWIVNEENTNINSNRLNTLINGLYTVSVYDEENDCWGEASYTVNDISINEVSSDIKIFPNPVFNTLHIKSKLNNQNTTIEVYNYLGKLLDAFQKKNSQHSQIDVSKLSSGIYIVKLKSEDFIIQKEFIKY
ncbi:MAG: T9SS type A sorting domain-containing protein [Flavobacteriales bacterium]